MKNFHAIKRTATFWHSSGPIIITCLLAFALRLYRLPEPLLRWDEGWTIAHGHLPWSELVRIAALEWHPPLFYLLFKIWQSLAGQVNFTLRFLAVLAGVLTVPLAYTAAHAWGRNRRLAILAALYAAAAPLLVYYGQVNRMYAWTPVGTLLATWALLRATDSPQPSRWRVVASGLATAAALYLLFYVAWSLAAVYLYLLLTRHRRWRAILTSGLLAAALFLPWLIYAAGTVQSRFYPTETLAQSLSQTLDFIKPSILGLVFAYESGWLAVWLVAGILLLGLLLTPPRLWRPLLLPALAVGITIAGVAYGAQAVRFFAPRHFVPTAPFLGLGLAWALNRLFARWKPLLPLSIVALVVAFWPTSSNFVYAKTLEVVDPFDPAADWHYLSARVLPDDLVFFNNLAKAGWYEQARAGAGAPWSYALRWDPIIEPVDTAIAPRIETAMQQHTRLWFVLYKGATGPNTALRDWLAAQERLYPLWEGWSSDTLFLGYVVPHHPLIDAAGRAEAVEQPINLIAARYTDTAHPGGGIAIELEWHIDGQVTADAKVFVHLVTADGHLAAQHDARPAGEDRPTQTLSPGDVILDRHGIGLPEQTEGPFTIRVGLYDALTGDRFLLWNGADFITLGRVKVQTDQRP